MTTSVAPTATRDEGGHAAPDARVAFATAVQLAGDGRLADALDELTTSWGADRSRTLDDRAADMAALHLASGNPSRALAALAIGMRGRRHVGERARTMLARCVAQHPRRLRRALAIACSAGSVRDRVVIGGAVVAARVRVR